MLRSLKGKVLCNVFNHQVYHDLSLWSREETAYVFLLMSISGNHTSPDVAFGFNGAMQIRFPDARKAISALKCRGYLVEDLPLDYLMEDVKVPEIKAYLKAHNLPVSGSRSALLQRLLPVLSSQELSTIKSSHSRWLPSAYGFEVLYSFYHLWDARLLAFLNALVAHKINQINAARDALFSLVPYTIGIGFGDNYFPITDADVEFISSHVDALFFIRSKYFKPEFYLVD